MASLFNTWIPFLYLYIVGGIFFATGLIIAVKSGALNRSIPRHRQWFRIMIFGFIFFFILHAFLIIAALYF
jgi:thiosulfate reductase cytochrome b subunit